MRGMRLAPVEISNLSHILVRQELGTCRGIQGVGDASHACTLRIFEFVNVAQIYMHGKLYVTRGLQYQLGRLGVFVV